MLASIRLCKLIMHGGCMQGAALHQEIAARDATLARAAELRADTERRQGALLEAEELQRRYTSDLAALKLGQDQIEVRHA